MGACTASLHGLVTDARSTRVFGGVWSRCSNATSPGSVYTPTRPLLHLRTSSTPALSRSASTSPSGRVNIGRAQLPVTRFSPMSLPTSSSRTVGRHPSRRFRSAHPSTERWSRKPMRSRPAPSLPSLPESQHPRHVAAQGSGYSAARPTGARKDSAGLRSIEPLPHRLASAPGRANRAEAAVDLHWRIQIGLGGCCPARAGEPARRFNEVSARMSIAAAIRFETRKETSSAPISEHPQTSTCIKPCPVELGERSASSADGKRPHRPRRPLGPRSSARRRRERARRHLLDRPRPRDHKELRRHLSLRRLSRRLSRLGPPARLSRPSPPGYLSRLSPLAPPSPPAQHARPLPSR